MDELHGRVRFACCDAQSISFPTSSFDAVVANHMLYNVPDRQKAYSEIGRVLRPGGYLYAATNGRNALKEIDELVQRVDPTESMPWRGPNHFLLENGLAELEQFFVQVEIDQYPDELRVTDPDAIPAFVLSVKRRGQEFILRLRDEITKELSDNGFVRITKDSGMFIARAP